MTPEERRELAERLAEEWSLTLRRAEPVKITVTDPQSGEVLGEQIIDNDYVLICAGNRHLAHTIAYANGTHILTIKRERAQ